MPTNLAMADLKPDISERNNGNHKTPFLLFDESLRYFSPIKFARFISVISSQLNLIGRPQAL